MRWKWKSDKIRICADIEAKAPAAERAPADAACPLPEDRCRRRCRYGGGRKSHLVVWEPSRNSPDGNLLSHFSEKCIEILNWSITHIFSNYKQQKEIVKMTLNIIKEKKY